MEFTFYWNWLKMLNKQLTDNWNTVVFQFVVKCSVEKYWIGEGEGMPRMIQLLKNICLLAGSYFSTRDLQSSLQHSNS